jgi:antirestriction protein ArdC
MTQVERQNEALTRATTGQALTNYGTIFTEFAERGIAEDDIRPRENVLTFHAWKALGRHVRKGEHGVRVITWVPVTERGKDGEPDRVSKRPKTAVVFHVSQTDAD